VPPAQVFVLPFPYPPWYALSTLWLALLPIDLAARVWFAVSIGILLLAIALLAAGQPPMRRAALMVAGLMWLPVLGSLFVGQYGFPVLLGAALMIYALQKQIPILVAVAAALLTFKPHLGGVVVLLVALQLAQRKDRNGRNTLLTLLAAGAILFVLGFLASPGWPLDYFHSLAGFKDVSQCTLCVSLPMVLAGLAGGGLDLAVWISAGIVVPLFLWLVLRWRRVTRTPGDLVTAGILVTMLASPYLQNYDYLLLLVPFIELAHGVQSTASWAGLTVAYVLPFISLALWGTAGNASLIASACILFVLAAHRLAPTINDPSQHD
jgi:hypothetical protein